MQGEDWADSVNPFPEATLAAQGLAKDVSVTVRAGFYNGPPPDMSHFNLLKVGLPGLFTEFIEQEAVTEFYTEEGVSNLIRLGEALERLAEGKLRLRDREEIDTITGKGLDAFYKSKNWRRGLSKI